MCPNATTIKHTWNRFCPSPAQKLPDQQTFERLLSITILSNCGKTSFILILARPTSGHILQPMTTLICPTYIESVAKLLPCILCNQQVHAYCCSSRIYESFSKLFYVKGRLEEINKKQQTVGHSLQPGNITPSRRGTRANNTRSASKQK